MPYKRKRCISQVYQHVLRRIHEVQLEDVVANTRIVTKDRIADKPSQAELDQIKPGCNVKVSENYERFWITVLFVSENNDIAGVVNNHLLKEHLFGYGDIIWLKETDVIEVFRPTA